MVHATHLHDAEPVEDVRPYQLHRGHADAPYVAHIVCIIVKAEKTARTDSVEMDVKCGVRGSGTPNTYEGSDRRALVGVPIPELEAADGPEATSRRVRTNQRCVIGQSSDVDAQLWQKKKERRKGERSETEAASEAQFSALSQLAASTALKERQPALSRSGCGLTTHDGSVRVLEDCSCLQQLCRPRRVVVDCSVVEVKHSDAAMGQARMAVHAICPRSTHNTRSTDVTARHFGP